MPEIKEDAIKTEQYPNMKPITVTRKGVLKLLLEINEHKATGPDQIPGKILKLCANELVDIYVTLFQASIDQGIVPNDWKTANIMPLFQKMINVALKIIDQYL